MEKKTLIADPKEIEIEYIRAKEEKVELVVKTKQQKAFCPMCQKASRKVHSRYQRKIADLPWQGIKVEMKLKSRRFFCQNEDCQQKIFCERLPKVVKAYARKTIRLNQALEVIGFALAAEAGKRVAGKLALDTSPDTLIRKVRQRAKEEKVPEETNPEIIGVDDWAFRRSKKYGTIIVELEKRKVLELLPDREGETLSNWLKKHPSVKIIARDRSGSYAEGSKKGAPLARQVIDRWHLLKNIGECVERFLSNHNQYIRAAAEIAINTEINSERKISFSSRSMLSSHKEEQSKNSEKKRYGKYKQVKELYKEGNTILAISKALKMSRMTVYKYVGAESFPKQAARKSRGSILDKYLPYINQRFAQGCNNINQIYREVVKEGYKGKRAMVRRYVGRLKKSLSELTKEEKLKILGANIKFKTPSTKQAMWLLIGKSKELEPIEKVFIEQLCKLEPKVAKLKVMADSFQEIIRHKLSHKLDDWFSDAQKSEVTEIKTFAKALEKEKAEFLAALQYPWSTSPVEGHINKLKMLKRQMFGRANLDLLEAKLLNYG